MSLGSKRGCSKVSATWWAWPLWNSLIEEFQGNALPSNSNLGFQVERRTLAECLALYSSPKIPAINLWLFYAVLGPSVASSPLRCPSLSSSSFASLDWKVCRVGKEEGEGEDWGEAESLGSPWMMTPCSSRRGYLSNLSSSSRPSLPPPQSCYPPGQL